MSRRVQRVAEAIRHVVSHAVLFELKDPRIAGVTVTLVEVSGDLRQAKVYVSVMGDAKTHTLVLNGLRSSRGFLQHKLAEELDLRYTPKIEFVLDEGVKKSLEMSRILEELAAQRGEAPAAAESDSQESQTLDLEENDDNEWKRP